MLHFFTAEERGEVYRRLHEAQTKGGVLAVSFKAHGDANETHGHVIDSLSAGPLVEGEDGINRLFVAQMDPMLEEARAAGYEVRKVLWWSVPGYNFEGQDGKFVGFIAVRR